MNRATIETLRKQYEHVPPGTWMVHHPHDVCRPDRREIWSTDDVGDESRVCNLPDSGAAVAQLIATTYNELPNLLAYIDELNNLLTTHEPHGHNVTNAQYVQVLKERDELRETLTKAADVWMTNRGVDYERKIAALDFGPAQELEQILTYRVTG